MTHTLFNEYQGDEARRRLADLAKSHTSPRKVIDAIVKIETGQTIERLRQIIQGEENEVYDVSPMSGVPFILRISHKEQDSYSVEAWAIESVRKVGVPVPEIMATGTFESDEKKLRYMIQQKMPGVTFDHLLWVDHMAPDRAKRITEAAGELLGRIHQVQTSGWGDFTSPDMAEFASLDENWEHLVNHKDNFVLALKPYKHLSLPSIGDILDFAKEGYMLSSGKQCLVQNDFAPKHLFIDDRDHIVGVIDFEDVQSADPIQDLAEWEFWFEESVPLAWLRTGHQRVQPLGDSYEARLAALRIERALWLLNDFADKGTAGEWGLKAAKHIQDAMRLGLK